MYDTISDFDFVRIREGLAHGAGHIPLCIFLFIIFLTVKSKYIFIEITGQLLYEIKSTKIDLLKPFYLSYGYKD